MSDKLFKQIVQIHGDQITEDFLKDYAAVLEQQPVFDASGWGWVMLFSSMSVKKQKLRLTARASMQSAGAFAWTPNRFDTSSGYRISRIAAPSRRGDPRQWLIFQSCSFRPRIQRRARHGFKPCSVSSNRTVGGFSPRACRGSSRDGGGG